MITKQLGARLIEIFKGDIYAPADSPDGYESILLRYGEDDYAAITDATTIEELDDLYAAWCHFRGEDYSDE